MRKIEIMRPDFDSRNYYNNPGIAIKNKTTEVVAEATHHEIPIEPETVSIVPQTGDESYTAVSTEGKLLEKTGEIDG